MYLSRLVLNPRHPVAQRDLADCHELHRTLMSAFPTAPEGVAARAHYGVLFRLELPRRGALPQVLVQSRAVPEWSRLPEGYLARNGTVPNPACKPVDWLLERLQPGATFRFRLRANPTRRVSARHPQEAERWHGKRVDLRGEERQLAWLAQRAERCGFELLHAAVESPQGPRVSVSPAGRVSGRREAGHRLTFGAVVFEGLGRVADPARFREALAGGIGPGKAYGFGLLSVAPAEA